MIRVIHRVIHTVINRSGGRGLAIALALTSAVAAAKNSSLKDVNAVIEQASKLTGQKYIYDKKTDGRRVSLSDNVEMTKENAEYLLTNVLLMNELTRVPSGQPDTFYIIEAKHAIQSPVPVYEGSLQKLPELPNTFDVVSVKYTMVDKHMAEQVQRFLTDLIPRYGRVTTYPDSSVLVITDAAQNIRRVIEVLRSVDRPLSAEAKRDIEQRIRSLRAAKKDAPPPSPGNG